MPNPMSHTRHRQHRVRGIGDAKIERIVTSWLGDDADAGTWLASVADEVTVDAGTIIGGGPFAYVLLDDAAACRFVGPGVGSVLTGRPTRVLVVRHADLDQAVRRFPALTDAWAAGLSRCAAAVA